MNLFQLTRVSHNTGFSRNQNAYYIRVNHYKIGYNSSHCELLGKWAQEKSVELRKKSEIGHQRGMAKKFQILLKAAWVLKIMRSSGKNSSRIGTIHLKPTLFGGMVDFELPDWKFLYRTWSFWLPRLEPSKLRKVPGSSLPLLQS